MRVPCSALLSAPARTQPMQGAWQQPAPTTCACSCIAGRPVPVQRKPCIYSPLQRRNGLIWCRSPYLLVRAEGSTSVQRRKQSSTGKAKQRSQQSGQKPPGWSLLDWRQYNRPWEISWGFPQLAFGMVGWASSFIVVGLLFVPLLIYLKESKVTELLAAIQYLAIDAMAKPSQSILVLLSQGLETVIGVALINTVVNRSGERPAGILELNFRDPLKPPSGWLFWAGLGVVTAPFIVGATAALFDALNPESLGGRGTADDVARILSLDLPSYASLMTVTAVMAPYLEETVFRGFLLPSLTKYMPTYAAVFVSSLAFAGCHLSVRDFPQLTALGMLLGFSYVRSRNLLTPMIIHGAWNGTVLSFLFLLLSQGIDVQQALSNR